MKRKVIIVVSCLIIVIGIICGVHIHNLYDSNLVNPDEIKTDSNFKNVTYDEVENIGDDILGILTIDKIGLKASVKEGSDNTTLKNYIGHIDNTSIYDGNIGLAAHNRGNKYSYFARINELEKGDIITYQTKFFTRNYKVDNIKTILETDWSTLQDSEDNKITLITCIANKKLQRLSVQATEIVDNDLQ